MPKIICFSGKSNSGKTTLICKLCALCEAQGKRVGVIKHDPKDKAEFDTLGKEKNKDSFKFFSASSGVAVISPFKSTILAHSDRIQDSQKSNQHEPYQAKNAEHVRATQWSGGEAEFTSAKTIPIDEIAQARTFTPLSAYEKQSFTKALEFFSDCDYIFVEGLKELPYKRIVVAREEIDKAYIPYASAFALSDSLAKSDKRAVLGDLKVLDLNNPQEILDFINALNS